MKKTIALLLVLLVSLALSAPLFSAAETAADPPAPDTPAVAVAQDAPVVQTAASEATEADPGGMPIDLTQLILGVLTIMMGALTRYVIPWIKARTNVWQRQLLTDVISTSVYAAEQLWGAGHGDEKLAYVMQNVGEKGFFVDRAIIESVVKTIPKDVTDSLKII